jgi:hypothetical protein
MHINFSPATGPAIAAMPWVCMYHHHTLI